MCYDAEASTKRQLNKAIQLGASKEEIDALALNLINIRRKKSGIEPLSEPDQIDTNELPVFYHVSGFDHPEMPIMTGAIVPKFEVAIWGFIPSWVKSKEEAYDYKKPYNSNLNAQSETMFESRVFKDSAKHRRCAIMLDAYYESHHQHKKTYPFRISHKDNKPLWVAGIYENNQWVDQESGETTYFKSFGILTCPSNEILAKIHNNPKMVARSGHRMLVILDESQLNDYLKPHPHEKDPQEAIIFQQSILAFCNPYDKDLLSYTPVRNLRKRKDLEYLGNVPEIRERYEWPDLNLELVFG